MLVLRYNIVGMVKLLKQQKYTVLTEGRDLKWPSLKAEFTQDALQLPESQM